MHHSRSKVCGVTGYPPVTQDSDSQPEEFFRRKGFPQVGELLRLKWPDKPSGQTFRPTLLQICLGLTNKELVSVDLMGARGRVGSRGKKSS